MEKKVYDLKVDPELRDLIPPLSEEEHRMLEDSIVRDGCDTPLTVWDGTIVDGHNRYEICVRHNIPFAYAEGYIERDPSVALIRPKASRKEERRPLTPEETRNILEVAETHPDGLILGVLYYLGLRRGEALGLKWGDFDFREDQVHIERDIDFSGSTAQEGELKTEAADRFVPIPPELKEMLLKQKGWPDE